MGTKWRIGIEVTDRARFQVRFFFPISIFPLPAPRSPFPGPWSPFPVPRSPFLLPRFGNLPPRVSLAPGLSLALFVHDP